MDTHTQLAVEIYLLLINRLANLPGLEAIKDSPHKDRLVANEKRERRSTSLATTHLFPVISISDYYKGSTLIMTSYNSHILTF